MECCETQMWTWTCWFPFSLCLSSLCISAVWSFRKTTNLPTARPVQTPFPPEVHLALSSWDRWLLSAWGLVSSPSFLQSLKLPLCLEELWSQMLWIKSQREGLLCQEALLVSVQQHHLFPDPLEKGKATHSSILAWRIPWTVYSPWGRKESHTRLTFTISLPLGNSALPWSATCVLEALCTTTLDRLGKHRRWPPFVHVFFFKISCVGGPGT